MGKLSQHAGHVATVASVIGMVQSIIVIVATSVLIAQYDDCSPDTNFTSKGFFFKLLKIHYFQDANCEVTSIDTIENLLASSQVFIWLIINLSFACVWLILSCLLKSVSIEGAFSYFPIVAYSWSACAAAIVVIDVTLAIFFAMDFATLNTLLGTMDVWEFGEITYRVDLLRIGAFLMMTLSLKGFVLEILNVSYIVSLIVLGAEAQCMKNAANEHPILSLGPLRAFDTGHVNRSYNNDNSSIRSSFENSGSNGRPYENSDSWHHSRAPDLSGSRPFSYLDYSRQRSVLPAAPSSSPSWQQDPWLTEPAPDYSPMPGKKLKSALKR